MKKILFVTSNDWTPWGGSEQLWYELALMFLKNKYEVAVSIKDWSPEPIHITQLKKEGAVILLREQPLNKSILTRGINKLLSKANESVHIKYLQDFKPDFAIISQGSNIDGIDWMFFCKNKKIPYFTIVQAALESFWPSMDMIDKMRESYMHCKVSYFVSKANLELTQIQAIATFPSAKVIFNPFNVNYNSSLSFPSVSDGILQIANVARHELQAKGQDVLFQVMSDSKWRNRPICINLYGKGFHSNAIKQLITYFEVDNIIYKGFEVTENIWKTNHALILPSRFEGLPLALVEAMLCGRFGIVTNVSGNKEVVIDNENGFLAAAPKPEYLDEAMERAWQRKDEWEQIGNLAKSYIKTIIPPHPVQHLYQDILSELK